MGKRKKGKMRATEAAPGHSVPLVLQLSRSTLVLNIGVAVVRMMGAISFWWTVSQGYLLFFLAAMEVCLEPFFQRRKWIRICMVGVLVGAFVWFNIGFVFTPAPLLTRCGTVSGFYPEGTVLSGIRWNPDLRDLRIMIENPSEEDYHDVDVTVRPDFPNVFITAIGETSNLGATFVTTELQAWQDVNGVPVVKFESTTGHTLNDGWKFADDPRRGMTMPRMVIPNHYRIRCATLPHRATLEVALAVSQNYLPKTGRISNVWIKGTYRGSFRIRTIDRTIRAD